MSFDNPLGAAALQLHILWSGDVEAGVGAGGEVIENDGRAGRRIRANGDADEIPRRDLEAGDGPRVLRVPLPPGMDGVLGVLVGRDDAAMADAGLQDVTAPLAMLLVPVHADPGTGGESARLPVPLLPRPVVWVGARDGPGGPDVGEMVVLAGGYDGARPVVRDVVPGFLVHLRRGLGLKGGCHERASARADFLPPDEFVWGFAHDGSGRQAVLDQVVIACLERIETFRRRDRQANSRRKLLVGRLERQRHGCRLNLIQTDWRGKNGLF